MLHTKLVMNEQTISFGSTNITKKAFAQLNELNLFVKNIGSPFKRALDESISDDLRSARRVHTHREIHYHALMAFLESFLV